MDLAVNRGYPVVADLNGSAGTGVGLVPLNIDSGIRVGPARAYLESAVWRPNLAVYSGTRVLRVLCSGGKATGVQVAVGNSVRTLTADRIILSAGLSRAQSCCCCRGWARQMNCVRWECSPLSICRAWARG